MADPAVDFDAAALRVFLLLDLASVEPTAFERLGVAGYGVLATANI